MRVTHLSASGEIGGAESVILACIRAGDGWPGAESSVVTLGTGPFLAAAERLGACIRPVPPPASLSEFGDSFATATSLARRIGPMALAFPAFFRRFSKTISELLPQVIHSHGIKTHVLAALLPRRAAVVWHLHDYVGLRPVASRLLSLLARRCDLVVAVSESVAEDARRWFPARVPVVVVHNPVDETRFVPDGPVLDLDALSGLPPAVAGTTRIGLPATFARWKGQEIFLAAVARMNHRDIRAYVIGGPLYSTGNSQWSQAELESLATELQLEGQVGFTGVVDDMPAAYRALDIVVHGSTRPEPFGLVITEAMACGRAVVASVAGGAGELFIPDQHAIGIEAGDANVLARALDGLVLDPQKRSALGRRARAHAVESFGSDRFVASLRCALSRVHSGSPE